MATLASGRPVIASRLPVFREIGEDGDCLVLVSPNAPLELAEAIRGVVDDAEKAKRLVTNARNLCLARSPEVVADLHAGVYGVNGLHGVSAPAGLAMAGVAG